MITAETIEAAPVPANGAVRMTMDKKLVQFLLNDLKILRFKVYWDDRTPYGTRFYFVLHYYLADNTCEINEAHCRNSIFMKRGPLRKSNFVNGIPAMLSSQAPLYLPEHLKVGDSINIQGWKMEIYDCDSVTQLFYLEQFGYNQRGRSSMFEGDLFWSVLE